MFPTECKQESSLFDVTHIDIYITDNRLRLQTINNPLIRLKIDVIKTCQSNIIHLDTISSDGCLETWNTPGDLINSPPLSRRYVTKH